MTMITVPYAYVEDQLLKTREEAPQHFLITCSGWTETWIPMLNVSIQTMPLNV